MSYTKYYVLVLDYHALTVYVSLEIQPYNVGSALCISIKRKLGMIYQVPCATHIEF